MKIIPLLIFVILFVSLVSSSQIVVPVSGSSQKICQLTGDYDKERQQPTLSQTATRYGVYGTDIGASFEHNGDLLFFFGDTFGRPNSQDSFAYTTDTNPDECLNLIFYTDTDGKFLAPKIPGVSLAEFEVSTDGVDINGNAYVVFTTDHTKEVIAGRSVLAKMNDQDKSFTKIYDLSTNHFIHIHFVEVQNSQFPGLPDNSGKGILIFGSGEYRKSNPYLAYISYNSIEDKSKIKYFAGLDAKGNPKWSSSESDSQPVFIDPVIGEFSVQWNPYLSKFIMLYTGGVMRSSSLPWKDWSDRQVIFDSWKDKGYCHFIHSAGPNKCDDVSDPNREATWGGAYGLSLIDSFTKQDSRGKSTIYYTLSTWNPYTVVLMKSEVELSGGTNNNTGNQGFFSRPLVKIFFALILLVAIIILIVLLIRFSRKK